MITLEQVRWAQQHDWYYYTGTCSVLGTTTVYVHDDMVKGSTLSFTDFEELKEWAGY